MFVIWRQTIVAIMWGTEVPAKRRNKKNLGPSPQKKIKTTNRAKLWYVKRGEGIVSPLFWSGWGRRKNTHKKEVCISRDTNEKRQVRTRDGNSCSPLPSPHQTEIATLFPPLPFAHASCQSLRTHHRTSAIPNDIFPQFRSRLLHIHANKNNNSLAHPPAPHRNGVFPTRTQRSSSPSFGPCTQLLSPVFDWRSQKKKKKKMNKEPPPFFLPFFFIWIWS